MYSTRLTTTCCHLALGALALACEASEAPGPTGMPMGGSGLPADDTPVTDAAYPGIPVETWGELNPSCPEYPPFTGAGAPRGPCCYRSVPNGPRVKQQVDRASELVTTEYRLNHWFTVNHPYALSLPPLPSLADGRNDRHESNMLFRFERPFVSGQPVAGPGWFTFGWGGYNCNGTHSYFGPTAAPVKASFPGAEDPARWAPLRLPVQYGPPGPDAGVPVMFADRNSANTFTPFINSESFSLEWELIAQGFTVESFDFTDAGLECDGSWGGAAERFEARHHFVSYLVVEDNHFPADNGIPTLQLQTMAQLVAFGPISGPTQDQDRVMLDPTPGGYARCQITQAELDTAMPRMRTCRWVKLPTVLCPITEQERALYRCHLGTDDNTDGPGGTAMQANCTMTAPQTPRDESAPDEGQCCDPMGNASSGLPACNAWITRSEFVAAAAEITDTDLDQLHTPCM